MTRAELTRSEVKEILSDLARYDYVDSQLGSQLAAQHGLTLQDIEWFQKGRGEKFVYGRAEPPPRIVFPQAAADEAEVDRHFAREAELVAALADFTKSKREINWDSYIKWLFILVIALPLAFCLSQPSHETKEQKLNREIREGQRAVCDKWGKLADGC